MTQVVKNIDIWYSGGTQEPAGQIKVVHTDDGQFIVSLAFTADTYRSAADLADAVFDAVAHRFAIVRGS